MVGGLTALLVYLLVNGPVLPDLSQANWVATGIVIVASAVVAFATHRFNTWYVLQWLSTGFLWSQWLMQDLANIFVYLPRETVVDPVTGDVTVTFSIGLLIFSTLLMLGLHALIFAARGGEIQKIVLSKTNTVDVRAATVVDFAFGVILMYFKEINDIPMSTTWVFLGLLAGRELAISVVAKLRGIKDAAFDVLTDIIRAFIGLVISVVMALGLPFLLQAICPISARRSASPGPSNRSPSRPNWSICPALMTACASSPTIKTPGSTPLSGGVFHVGSREN